ncbi:MAG: TIGR00268 family protein [Nitrospirae bacterium GWC2_56_14]|nr:MAG: TIGR00268 family protein [Nitrospirae bacterium GWC2_56_14]
MTSEQKWDRLRELLREMKLAVLAYSGGVDSSLLLRAASEVMGPHLIAVTAVSETYPQGELEAAQAFVRSLGVTHRIIHTRELDNEQFAQNPPERCFHCKNELFQKLAHLASTEGIPFILDGSNTDDLNDHRPGRRAAEAFSVRSPLVEAGIDKAEVRRLASLLNLPQWDKPSLACLSSRIPYGTRITRDILDRVQQAENFLHGLGFRQVRVRHHGDTARIELDKNDFSQLLTGDVADRVTAQLKELGYTYVSLDLAGYRTGSMNEGIKQSSQESVVGSQEK